MIKLKEIRYDSHWLTEKDGQLVICDIQPEYENGMAFILREFFEYVWNNFKELNITYLYNGNDTLGMITEDELKNWIYEVYDYDEEFIDFIDESVSFYDKGYAFFRYCMDSGIDDESTVKLVKYMYKNDIRDSRDLGDTLWEEFRGKYSDESIQKLLERGEDCIYIPDLMDELKTIRNNIVLVGGGIDECLKEVEIALLALNKSYKVEHLWTF